MAEQCAQHFYWQKMQLTGQNLHNKHAQCSMHGDAIFKGSDSSCLSVYFYSVVRTFYTLKLGNLARSPLCRLSILRILNDDPHGVCYDEI